MKLPKQLIEKLQERKEDNSFRSLHIYPDGVDFFSNDYLGAAKRISTRVGKEGSTGSRLISGNSERTLAIEAELATFFDSPSALFFNSGYDANLGFFSCVPQKGDTVIYDQLVHASIRDGIRMGVARSYSFAHNNITELKKKITRAEGNVYVVVESLYSMDGDQADLIAISAICEEVGAYLVVDEAHSGGVYGEKGKGMVYAEGLQQKVFARLITFGKAYGSHGAIVLGGDELKDFLVNFSRPLIYTTALSPLLQERLVDVVGQVAKMDKERQKLFENIQLFRAEARAHNLALIDSESAIQAILISGNTKALNCAKILNNKGYNVKAILSPTVPKGEERIRICLHSFNSEADIRGLIKTLHG